MRTRLCLFVGLVAVSFSPFAAEPAPPSSLRVAASESEFQVVADQFADIQVLRYRVPEFDQLSLKQKKLAYYLTEAGLAGRDIFYDQKYKHNLAIRKTLEAILKTYSGDKNADDFKKLAVYAKRFF